MLCVPDLLDELITAAKAGNDAEAMRLRGMLIGVMADAGRELTARGIALPHGALADTQGA